MINSREISMFNHLGKFEILNPYGGGRLLLSKLNLTEKISLLNHIKTIETAEDNENYKRINSTINKLRVSINNETKIFNDIGC